MQTFLTGISKSFPGVKALQGVNVIINAGEIHAICGENGAGKSTLMNILSGNLQPDQGTIQIDGHEVFIDSPQRAFDLGIAIVYQHLSVIDSLSIAENIFANRQPVTRYGFIRFDQLYQMTRELLGSLGIQLDPGQLVAELSAAEKQMVEIAKALSKKPRLLILDEPTASISEKETLALFRIMEKLKSDGVAMLYISHRLNEIFSICDRVTIMKDGISQGSFPISTINRESLIEKMVGRKLEVIATRKTKKAEVILEAKSLSGKRFTNISFRLHKGEILGFAGLVGAGRSEVARAIFGMDALHSGEVLLHGVPATFRHPAEAISRHIAYVPEDRKHLGLFMEMSVAGNIIAGNLSAAMHNGSFSDPISHTLAQRARDQLRIATPDVLQTVSNLSGGNQQKVVLGKWLLTNPEVLIVDEPTHGIDVGARHEIYRILASLAEKGKGIIMISSDMTELLAICDDIIVMKEGVVSGTLSAGQATEQMIMALAAN